MTEEASISDETESHGWTAIVNARVHSLDDANTTAEAVAFADGRIVFIGSAEELGARAEHTIDAQGALVFPGFVDAHHHVSISALYGGQIDLSAAKDIVEIQAILRTAAEASTGEGWLVATGWDEFELRERRAPTRAELDDAVSDLPLFALHYTCHRAVANSRALALAGIGAQTADPPGGSISRGRSGAPDGLLIERGMSRVEALARASLVRHDTEAMLRRMASHYRQLVAAGITLVADTTVPLDLIGLYEESARRGDVVVPTIICPVSADGWLEEPRDVIDATLKFAEDGPLRLGPVKLVFDGAPQCAMCMTWWSALGAMARTALLTVRTGAFDAARTAISVRPRLGTRVRSGISIYDAAQANRVVQSLTERGFAVATHAIGNAAVRVALDAYEASGSALHAAGRARLEHASFLDHELVADIARCGAAVVVQPDFIRLPAYAGAPAIPGLPFFPIRQLLDAGVLVAGSSDYPVAGFDPLDGVRSAVRRLTATGFVKEPEERVTLDEALRMYTRGAAETCGRLHETGTLERGKRADLIVLDGTLDDPDTLCVRETYIGGLRA